MGLKTEIWYASRQKDGRGWIGDIKNMLLSTEKLKKTGWKTNHSSKESISLAAKKMIDSNYNTIKKYNPKSSPHLWSYKDIDPQNHHERPNRSLVMLKGEDFDSLYRNRIYSLV
jgi:hypothetical protein